MIAFMNLHILRCHNKNRVNWSMINFYYSPEPLALILRDFSSSIDEL